MFFSQPELELLSLGDVPNGEGYPRAPCLNVSQFTSRRSIRQIRDFIVDNVLCDFSDSVQVLFVHFSLQDEQAAGLHKQAEDVLALRTVFTLNLKKYFEVKASE